MHFCLLKNIIIIYLIVYYSYYRIAMNCLTTFNLMADVTTTVAIYSSGKLFTTEAFVSQSILCISSTYYNEINKIQRKKNCSSLSAYSDLDWNKLPLTYNKYQGSTKLTFDIFQKKGYHFFVR